MQRVILTPMRSSLTFPMCLPIPPRHKSNFDFMFQFTAKLVLFSTFGICFMPFSLYLTVNQNSIRASNLRFINRICPKTRCYRNFMCSNIAFYPVFGHFPNLRFISVNISPVNELFTEIFSAIQSEESIIDCSLFTIINP